MSESLRQWAEVEHDEVEKACLSTLDAQVEPAELVERLKGFEPLLREHFHDEEKPGGFFAELVQLFPGHAPRVAELQAEHATLLAALHELSAAAASAAALPERQAALAKQLRAHAAAENQLLQDTYLQDTGGF